MTNLRTFVLAVGVSAAAGLSVAQLAAQSARGEQAPVPPARVVGLVGCLERIPPAAGRASQTAAASAPAFRLINVHAADAPASAGARVGATPPAAQAPLVLDQEYLIVAADTVRLTDHVNTRVEVTGTLSPVPEAAPPQPQRGETKAAPAAPRLSVLRVTAIKAVSSECK